MANSIHFNSIDLSGEDYGLTVKRGSYPIGAMPRVDIQEAAFGPGASQRVTYTPREFEIEVTIKGSSDSDLQDKLDNLASLFAQEEEKSLRFDVIFPTRYWLARYTGGLEKFEFRGMYSMQGSLSFVAPDPIGFKTTERTSPDEIVTGTTDTFTIENSTAVGGTWYATPVWIIKATNGASSYIDFENTTTSERMIWYGSLASGDWLKIDSYLQRIYKSTDSGANWSINQSSISGDFPRLKPRVQNNFSISGMTDGATISFTYRERFL